jgi:methyl-accepting chemotaxis protein
MQKLLSLLIVSSAVCVFLSIPALAEDVCTQEKVVQAVDEAVAILEEEGDAGLEKVGQIRFCNDNYVFVNDLKGKTLMHIKPHLVGKVLISLKDDTGKRFFAEFTKVAKQSKADKIKGAKYYNGKGWVEYRWPKPGQEAFSPKVSYIRACLMGATNVYVGAGIYK